MDDLLETFKRTMEGFRHWLCDFGARVNTIDSTAIVLDDEEKALPPSKERDHEYVRAPKTDHKA